MDPPGVIRGKIRKAVTDPGREIVQRADKPAISNLVTIYSLVSGKTILEVEDLYRGKGYLEFKTDLADVIIDFLSPFQERYFSLSEELIIKVLSRGASRAEKIAAKTLVEVREKVGLVPHASP